MRVGVVGAGVAGLSTALALLEAERDVEVELLADRPQSEATSAGPPGVFRPHPTGPREWNRRTVRATHDRLSQLLGSAEAAEAGIALVHGAVLSPSPAWAREAEELYGDIVHTFRPSMGAEERRLYSAVPYEHGFVHSAFVTPGKSYFPYLQRKVLALGARLRREKVERLEDLAGRYDLVFNCSGLGARWLAHDQAVTPVRGLLVELRAPWIKHFCFAGDTATYMVPSQDSVFIGGTREEGAWDRTVDEGTRQAVLDRAFRHWPSLRKAEVMGTWVGLRPFRPQGPRIELERLSNRLPVIHNYGHGSNGFVLSWGSALQAVELFQEQQRAVSKL